MHVLKWRKAVVTQKSYYDQKHRDMQFAVGDTVLLSTQNLRLKGIPHKLQRKFCGPYKILEKIGAQAYRLKLPDVENTSRVSCVTAQTMEAKHCATSSWRGRTWRTQTNLSTSTWKRFYVGDGVQRPGDDDAKFLVLWQGYPDEDAEWIPASYFSDHKRTPEPTSRPTEFPKSMMKLLLVSVDRSQQYSPP